MAADDDLDAYIADASADPTFRCAYVAAGERARLIRELAAWRQGRNLSSQEVARTMGTTVEAVSALEGGAVDPPHSTLTLYAVAVGASLRLALCEVTP